MNTQILKFFIPLSTILIFYYFIKTLFSLHQQETDALLLAYNFIQQISINYYKKQGFPFVQQCAQYNKNDLYCSQKLKIDGGSQYCQQSDIFKLLHPDIVLQDIYILREKDDIMRNYYARNYGYDAQPQLNQETQYLNKSLYLPKETSLINFGYSYHHNHFKIGTSILCLFQKQLNIPGSISFTKKSILPMFLEEYRTKLLQAKAKMECLKESNIQLKSYRLSDLEECKLALQILNSQQHMELLQYKGVQYVLKTDAHWGSGFSLIWENQINDINSWYGNGAKCGYNHTQVVVQQYLQNPMLLSKKKIEMRVYLFIAELDPLIAYVSKRVIIRQCSKEFNLKSKEKDAHSYKAESSKQYLDEMSIKDLARYFQAIGVPNWQQSYEIQIQSIVYHLIESVKLQLYQSNQFGEFFALDIIADDKGKLWLLEINQNPEFNNKLKDRFYIYKNILFEYYNLANLYIRHRYQLIRKFLFNMLIPSILKNEFNENKEKLQFDLIEILQNTKLEYSSQYFHKVIDHNDIEYFKGKTKCV